MFKNLKVCVDGDRNAYIGVGVGYGYGPVALQYSRSAANTLVSIKAFGYQLQRVSGDDNRVIVHHHNDDDKSFLGVVGVHAIEK